MRNQHILYLLIILPDYILIVNLIIRLYACPLTSHVLMVTLPILIPKGIYRRAVRRKTNFLTRTKKSHSMGTFLACFGLYWLFFVPRDDILAVTSSKHHVAAAAATEGNTLKSGSMYRSIP